MNKKYIAIKNQLDSVGPGMCLAKWKQVTIHLSTGLTHSCHHPSPHHIPVSEIKQDVTALHNTNYKKEQRQQMLEGQRPDECQYCWNVEDRVENENVFSDRVLKSAEEYCEPFYDEVMSAGWEKSINPSYLEISFSYGCNFKCSYCNPETSSKWMEEIQQHGAYPTSRKYNNIEYLKLANKMPIPEREENPYVDAFWKWWPDLYPSLHTFRITGGEPLLSKHTFKVLDYIIENPNPNLELAINTNLGIPTKILEEFIEKLKIIQDNQLVKHITIFTSCEAKGNKAEYIRYGLNYKEWLTHCELLLSNLPRVQLTLMSTYNALSVTSFTEFLKDMLALKRKFLIRGQNYRDVNISIPYLRYPDWMSIGILTPDFLIHTEESFEFMKANNQYFKDYEISFMERIYDLFAATLQSQSRELARLRNDFVAFVDEHDRRRLTNFLETFPEYTEFYNRCKSYNNDLLD